MEPRGPSFFDTLVEDNLRARYVQNIRSMEYSARVEELTGFFRDQRWMHMHAVLRSQEITLEELGRQGREAALDTLEEEGFSREEASTELGHRGRGGVLASLEAQGFTGEDGTRSASTELGHRGRGGSLASLEAQGFTGKGGARSASWELGHCGGEASSAIYRTSGNCIVEGCNKAINTGEFCKQHRPIKPAVEKSDKCRSCGRVIGVNERVRRGVCNSCYCKPEARDARKKTKAATNAARGTCNTPGCKRVNDKGRDKCNACWRKYK